MGLLERPQNIVEAICKYHGVPQQTRRSMRCKASNTSKDPLARHADRDDCTSAGACNSGVWDGIPQFMNADVLPTLVGYLQKTSLNVCTHLSGPGTAASWLNKRKHRHQINRQSMWTSVCRNLCVRCGNLVDLQCNTSCK